MSGVVAIIPARAGSKGIPNKNMLDLGGYPLIQWSIAACLKSKLIDRTIVSTDSEEYAKKCVSLGAEVPFLRPAKISDDHSTDYEFVQHALDWFSSYETDPRLIVHIRPTTPLRLPEIITQAITAFENTSDATALRSVHEMSESAHKTFEIAENGHLKRLNAENSELDAANNARQEFPPTYVANGYVDVLSTKFIRHKQLLHGNKVMPFITPVTPEIDTIEDFEFIEYSLQRDRSFAVNLFS